MEEPNATEPSVKPARVPWNKGKVVGAKPPLRPSHVWSIRTKLQIEDKKRDLALFNLAIDSKLRGCDVVAVRVDDVAPSGYTMDRATIRQKKTGRPVRFEITDQARQAIDAYPSERRPHLIDLTGLGEEKAGAFYDLAAERICNEIERLHAAGSDVEQTKHLSVFGLAPIPLLVLLGRRLSNKVPVNFFQCHRNRPDRWTWYDSGDTARFATTRLRAGSSTGKVALLVSLSGRLGLADLPAGVDAQVPVYEIAVDGPVPDTGILRRREDLEGFRQAYRSLLSRLRAEHAGRLELHLLAAAPAPVAIACGYDLLPKVDPNIVTYDNVKPHGFVERLKVNNHERF